jgi:hypothetical protein
MTVPKCGDRDYRESAARESRGKTLQVVGSAIPTPLCCCSASYGNRTLLMLDAFGFLAVRIRSDTFVIFSRSYSYL